MKRVIKNQKKMKNTMYIVFGVFALALFGVTMLNPSYAEEGLIIDDALDAIMQGTEMYGSGGFEKVEEEKLIQPVEDNESEDVVEPELAPDERLSGGGENSQNLENDEENNNEDEETINIEEADNGVNDENEDGDEGGKTEKSGKASETEEWDTQSEVETPEATSDRENHEVLDENSEEIHGVNVDDLGFKSLDNDLSISEVNSGNPYIVYDEVNGLITVYTGDFSYGITIKDKNLGSEVSGTGTESIGNYYRWGYNTPITSTNSSSTSNIDAWGGGDDVLENDGENENIIKGYNKILHKSTNLENRRGPCPENYHIASAGERNELIKLYYNAKGLKNLIEEKTYSLEQWSVVVKSDPEKIFVNDLKFPFPGSRYHNGNVVFTEGSNGGYWTSSPVGGSYTSHARYFYATQNGRLNVTTDYDIRSFTFPIRCFKNDYIRHPKTITYNPNGGAFPGMDVNEIKEYTYNYSGTEIIPIYNIQIPDRISEDMSQQSGWMFAGWYTTATNQTEEFDISNPQTTTAYAKWLPFNDLSITMSGVEFTIMDRNIGAKYSDEGIYNSEGNYNNEKIGLYFQRGNNYGFRGEILDSNSSTSTINAQEFEPSTIYNNKFIVRNDGYYGRDLPENKNLRGQSELYDNGRKGPCPKGYHIPQEKEWKKIIEIFNNWKTTDECFQFYSNYNFSSSNYCFSKKLRLPYTSYIGTNGVYYGEGKGIKYRTSTHETYPQNYSLYMNNARYFSFRLSDNNIFVGQNLKAQALPLRCFKDEIKKIVYETNGGYFDNTPITITTWWGENIRSLTVPKKNDLPNAFGGWYTTENFEEGTLVTGSNLRSDTDEIKLYAKWDANIFTVSFDADNDDVNPENITVTYDSQYPEMPVVNKTGYIFTGWYNGEEKINSGDVVQITEDTTLKARRETNKYKIIFDTDGGNEINPIEKDYNSSLSGMNLPAPTKECNEFSGWDVELPETMPAHDITLKAIWNYTCSRSSGGGGRKSETTTREIAIDTNTENEHNSADEKDNVEKAEENKTVTNNETSNQVISVTQEVSEDGKVEAIVETIKIKDTDIIATVRAEVSTSSSSSNTTHTKEQNEAYSFAKSNGITSTSSIETAKMDTELTRIQMAKMVSNYAINVLGQEPDVEKGVPDFKDVTAKMDKQYDNAVTKAYQLGIMGQNVENNKFRPNDEVTRAEFSATLSRLLYNTDEGKYKGTGKYYIPHVAKLYNEGIINKMNPVLKEKRGYVMTMLMRTVK